MEERWDVFAEGNVVFLHRSWAGNGLFEATFAPADGGGWQIAEAVAERDPERYRSNDDEYDSLTLEVVLSVIVLGEPAEELRETLRELTRKRWGNADVPAGTG
ncbi:hypothetical protein [Herbidospora mongoliensis]|uniref:hypothetical protein n=1 Tax=Herbidospora mongoliensis TaxID=688067 RepID=UPI001C3F2755|nr:hypothetical protein [Herbidospora mongoliensis]